jgi:hypothetical protein
MGAEVVVALEVGGRFDAIENVYDDVLFDDSTSVKHPNSVYRSRFTLCVRNNHFRW